ncbi:hypothetical protein ACFQAV_01215 [Companilactobacillus huachuanensis]|uniref:Uncharacterized protein n=1 Tax=Companilactobacillus huachuanensis TaxID=2559914 RepID=A0ABW1RHE5_9LACO|nr:hypothetical protein [Companilactobacillus huachuanensis]
MFSINFILGLALYFLGIVLCLIGIFKVIRIKKVFLNTYNKSLYKLEVLSYTLALQKKYPEKLLYMEHLYKVAEVLKVSLYIGIGVTLSLIYMVLEYDDSTGIRLISVFFSIFIIIYMYICKKLIHTKKDMLDFFFIQNNENNKQILNAGLVYADDALNNYGFIYVGILIVIVGLNVI